MYEKICPYCKRKLSEYYATGMLGCPYCYKVFKKEITETLGEIQVEDYHVGKKPRITGVDRQLLEEYKRLKAEHELAAKEGRISDMANISSDILGLEEELKRRGIF